MLCLLLQISRATLLHNEFSWMQSNGVNVIELPCIYVMEWLPSHPHECVTLASIQYVRCIYSTAKIHESVAGAVDNL
jgi:hypothetical protein